MKKKLAVVVTVLLALAGLVHAQTPAPKPATAMIYIPVGVRDRRTCLSPASKRITLFSSRTTSNRP